MTTDSLTAPAVRPGWRESIVGLVAFGVTAVAAAVLFQRLGLDKTTNGVLMTALSGVAGLAGFGVAALIRIRDVRTFGVRRTSWRWMLIGVAGGVVALVVKGAVTYAITAFTGFDSNPQGTYYDAAGGGVLPLILTFLFLAVLTPIGEEFLFRGVIANALLRVGPVVGVLVSAAIFALAHGINIVLPAAFVVGVIAAELMRRSGSIWPAVAVHVVHNTALPLYVMLSGATGPS